MVRQMHGEPVEAVRDRRTGRTPGAVVRAEHEMVDEELRAAAEEIRQRGVAFVGLEPILLVDPNPWQFLTPLRQPVAASRQLLLRLEQVDTRSEPLLAGPGPVLRHRSGLLPSQVFRHTLPSRYEVFHSRPRDKSYLQRIEW